MSEEDSTRDAVNLCTRFFFFFKETLETTTCFDNYTRRNKETVERMTGIEREEKIDWEFKLILSELKSKKRA